MRTFVIQILTGTLLLSASCSGNKQTAANASVDTDSVEELELPVIPENITDPNERADYLAMHFWDKMDFRDTARSYNTAFVEQNFANFISFLPYASDTLKIIDGFSVMLKKAEIDRKAFDKLMTTADDYLYDPNSPMLSEDLYILYLRSVLKSDYLSNDEKLRTRYRLEQVSKNRPGMKAADFKYTTLDGKVKTLRKSLPPNDLMLIFFDPECENCEKIITRIMEDKNLTDDIAAGNISVLAVYPGDNMESWRKKAATMPSTWTIGISDDIDENESYYLPAMPIIYILDSTGTVVKKDLQF